MITRFGSLADALQADPDRLAEVPGLGEAAASLWRTLRECGARAACRPLAARKNSPRQSRSATWSRSRLGHLTKEEFWVILVDNQNRLIRFERVFRGTVDQTAAYPREILELALLHHASGLILVHNHPGGDPTPSRQDRTLTETLAPVGRGPGAAPAGPHHRHRPQLFQLPRPRTALILPQRA
ncbi:hypothetical protein MASR1M66_21450 [Aminivibrio sp.]